MLLQGMLEKGVIHVYTGHGKGKTTAAIGLGMRAVGAGLKVYMIQFMKGYPYSEIEALEKVDNFTVKQFGRADFVDKKNPAEVDIKFAQDALNHAYEVVTSNRYDVVILDEVNVAMDYNLIDTASVLNLLEQKPSTMEIILTGRYAPQEITKYTDLVTEMLEIKHPFQNGMPCRAGIDR